MINPMRILVRLVLDRKFLKIISRCCATLSAIGCTMHDSLICAWSLVTYACNDSRSHVCHDSPPTAVDDTLLYQRAHELRRFIFQRLPRPHVPVTKDSFICMPWLIHVCHVCVMTHSYVSHISYSTHMNESWHTHEWVMTHSYVLHISYSTHMNESWHTHEWVMTHSYVSHVSHISSTCAPIRMCGIAHSRVCHDSFVRHDSFMCVPWLVHMRAMTRSCVRHGSFICVPWLVLVCAMARLYVCVMTHSCVCHDSFICVPWLVHMCAVTRSYACYYSSICVPWLVHMCVVTHPNVRHDQFMCVP